MSIALSILNFTISNLLTIFFQKGLIALFIFGLIVVLFIFWLAIFRNHRKSKEDRIVTKGNLKGTIESADKQTRGPMNFHPLLSFSNLLYHIVEQRIINGIEKGVTNLVLYSSRQLRWIQSGQVGLYVLLMVLGLIALFIIQFLF